MSYYTAWRDHSLVYGHGHLHQGLHGGIHRHHTHGDNHNDIPHMMPRHSSWTQRRTKAPRHLLLRRKSDSVEIVFNLHRTDNRMVTIRTSGVHRYTHANSFRIVAIRRTLTHYGDPMEYLWWIEHCTSITKKVSLCPRQVPCIKLQALVTAEQRSKTVEDNPSCASGRPKTLCVMRQSRIAARQNSGTQDSGSLIGERGSDSRSYKFFGIWQRIYSVL